MGPRLMQSHNDGGTEFAYVSGVEEHKADSQAESEVARQSCKELVDEQWLLSLVQRHVAHWLQVEGVLCSLYLESLFRSGRQNTILMHRICSDQS